jgi:hypothetical protein
MEFLNQWLSPEAVETVTGSTFLSIAGGAFLVFMLAWCRIFARAGFHASLGLLMAVPGVNLVMLLVLGFASWPRERELKALRRVQRASRNVDDAAIRRAA